MPPRKRKSAARKQSPSISSVHVETETTSSNTMKFGDVQDALSPFTGDGHCSVVKWLNDFEEMALLCAWSDLHKFVYCKRLLLGTAQAFVRSEDGLNSWTVLRARLLAEFRSRLTTADVHRLLSADVKQRNETLLQYLYRMRELAMQGGVSDDSLIDYVICGIPDAVVNKSILYGATSIPEFKVKLELYDRMCERRNDEARNAPLAPAHNVPVEIRCYNCGDRGHQSRECPDAVKGPKCFACRAYGHKSFACPTKSNNQHAGASGRSNGPGNVYQVNALNTDGRIVKPVYILGQEALALVDTGCDMHLCRESFLKRLSGIHSIPSRTQLNGPADACFHTDRRFKCELTVDGESYHVDVHSVPDGSIGYDVILGRPLFQTNAVLRVSPQSVTITHVDTAQQLMNVNTSVDELDVGVRAQSVVVQELIDTYCPVQGVTAPMKTVIVLFDETPVFQRPRRLAPREKMAVDKQIQEWLSEGIIRPSCSEYASPVVLVKKKDGTLRLCIDFRELNKKIVRDRYPLPLIDDQIDRLRGAVVFSTLDLRNGFFHVPVDEASVKYTSFVVPNGQYEFLRTPFGLCISPPMFQRYVNFIFRDLIRLGHLLAYMDDLIVVAANVEEGMVRLKNVLHVAAENGLDIKWSKCQFLKDSIDYLGYRIRHNEVSPSEAKTIAVQKFPLPRTAKAVQSFLGLTGYFRRFIRGYSQIALPLSNLLKQGVLFHMGLPQEAAVDSLKQCLSAAPVLKIYNPEAVRTELHTDASQFGFGAVLLQSDDSDDERLHPICYMSKKTSEAQQKFHSYELEVLAIVEALKKFRVYLLGLSFKIVTDCAAFTKTLEKRELATRVARWALLITEYDYVIEHRAGSRMPHVDSLSRYPMCMVIHSEFLARLRVAQQEDLRIQQMTIDDQTFTTVGGLIYEIRDGQNLLVVPCKMQNEVIRKAHHIGHFGIMKTEALIQRDYSITDLRNKISKVINNCVTCILANRKQGRKEGFLHSIDKGDTPLSMWHIDFLGPLTPTPKGYRHILAVIDGFTKFCWLFPTKSVTAKEVIDKLAVMEATFGNPEKLVSDRGTAFTSKDFGNYCSEREIRHILITTGVPRANGQVERLNAIIINVLAKLSMNEPDQWYRQVPKVQMALNGSYQRSIGMTPFKLVFGVEMNHPEYQSIKEAVQIEYVRCHEEGQEENRQFAKEQIQKAQIQQQRTFNKSRKEAVSYRLGDLVAIKRTQFLPSSKLCRKFLGPYRVTGREGNERYKVLRIGTHEGPERSYSCAEYMKLWCSGDQDQVEESSEGDTASEADAVQGGRMWGGNTGVDQVEPRQCDDPSREASDVVTTDEL